MDRQDFDLDSFLPYQFALLAGRLSRGFARTYQDRFGISVAEWRVVAHLAQSGKVSVREIHRRVDLDKSKVSRAAARLEAAGYLMKRQSNHDKRLVELSLTKKGHDMVTDLQQLANAYQEKVVAQLGTERDATIKGLHRLIAADDL